MKTTSQKKRLKRRGVALVEGAIVLSVVLILILGFFDLGLAVTRYNALCEGSRRAARAVIVRGSMASDLGVVGTTTMNFTADDPGAIATSFRFLLATMDPKDVNIKIEWLDGDNQLDQKIRVTLSYQHKTAVPIPFGYGTRNLQSASTMYIAH